MFMLRIELTGVSTFKVIYGGDIEIVLRSFEKVWYDWLTDVKREGFLLVKIGAVIVYLCMRSEVI